MASSNHRSRIRIGINAHLLSNKPGYRRAGIHHYIAKVINHLPRSDVDRDYTVFTNSLADLVTDPSLSVASTSWPTERPMMRILWEQFAWPLAAVRREFNLLHSMAFVTPILSPCPTVVTVFDLSFIHFPEQFPRLQSQYLASQTKRSCRSARRVVAISESGRQDIHRTFKIPLERIDVVYPGVDASFRPLPSDEVEVFRERQALPRRYILHVGTLQPRKNLPVLFEALALMKRPELGLILVGGKGWIYDEIFARVRELNLERQVRFTNYVPDEDLALWYNAASVLVIPSIYEGFGMPVGEAMACGIPVITSRSSSLPEVGGEATLTFNAQDPVQSATELAQHLTEVLDNPQIEVTMRERGPVQAGRFTWQRAGREMAQVYQRALD